MKQLALRTNYALSSDFIILVEQIDGCSIKNVIEIISNELLEYWIECPKEKEDLITEMAFMTFIKNTKFQKYYQNTKAFKKIDRINEHR